MKTPTLFIVWTIFVLMALPLGSNGQDPDWKPPGAEEIAAVDQANKRLDAVYKRLMSKLEADEQKPLKDAERSWIKWRDDEALLSARMSGAGPTGSTLRVEFANAQLKLINERIDVLNEYLKQLAER